MPCPPLEYSPADSLTDIPSPRTTSTWVGHKIKAPVQPLRGPWDKYSPQEVEETNSTKCQESPPGDEARSGQVAHTNTPSTAEDRGSQAR